ncbi:MAG TPA: DUF4105 domain-containing protein [Gemmatimonadaceae bacterium]|nr:DUF4105 domain-containing protein [Gemmatimonadaceae bacterium]
MSRPRSTFRRVALALVGIAALALAGFTAVVLSRRPSNDRDWSPDQRELATARFAGDSVWVHNVRNARYRTTHDYDVVYEDRAYDLRGIESVWFVVEPFSGHKGPAHTFVTFGFRDGQYVAISVEIRKEKGESFSPWRGMTRGFELTYVVGDERDLIGLRANFRHDSVYLYRTTATPAKARQLFVSMLERANHLAAHPEFYNTLTSTCTTNIVRHVNEIAPKKVPFSFKVLLPAYADELAYRIGLIDTTVPFDTLRARAKINTRAAAAADSAGFSRLIRS